jgi:hypothetical protein
LCVAFHEVRAIAAVRGTDSLILKNIAATVQRRTATAGGGLGLAEYSSSVFALEHWKKKKKKRISN